MIKEMEKHVRNVKSPIWIRWKIGMFGIFRLRKKEHHQFWDIKIRKRSSPASRRILTFSYYPIYTTYSFTLA